MALAPYQKIALRWQPAQKEDRVFALIATVCVVVALVAGVFISTVEVPEKPRQQRTEVPERVAKFISQKKPKPKPLPPKPKPKPKPPEPKLEVKEPEVKVVRDRPKPKPKPLTESQQKARDVAAKSGLMEHLAELNDLVDVADVSAQVQGTIKQAGAGDKAAGHDVEVLTANVNRDSGGVDSARYATTAGNSQLGRGELAAAKAALSASQAEFEEIKAKRPETAGGARSEEEITLVFDRQKAKLQSLYNRARRKNPALKGKLVLEITILASGSVKSVHVLSSELNDEALVKRLLARVKNFQFGARDVAETTVTYPIEFLPF